MTNQFTTECWLTEKDGTRIDKIDDAQVQSIKWKRNGDGDATITFHPLLESAASVKTAKQETQIWVNGELQWWGVNDNLSGKASGLTLLLPGLASYFEDRWLAAETKTWGPIDQLAIGAALVAYAQTDSKQGSNAELNIDTASFSASGINRKMTYELDDNHNIYEALRNFSTMDNGFEWDITYSNDGHRWWTPGYPQRGSVKPLYLEYGREIIDYDWMENGSVITRLKMTGGTPKIKVEDGPDITLAKLYQIYESVPASNMYGVRYQVVAGGNEATIAELLAQARNGVNLRKHPFLVSSVTVKNTEFDIFEEGVICGDSLHFKIDHGRVQVENYSRIDTIEWSPKNTKFTFVQPGG